MGNLPADAFGELCFCVGYQVHRTNSHTTALAVQLNANKDGVIGKGFDLCHVPSLASNGSNEKPRSGNGPSGAVMGEPSV